MNVILISIDTLRFDCVGYQPDRRELRKHNVEGLLATHTLDGIAEKSLCFTNCFSTNTYTTSAHASVFTGLYPPRHGLRAFFETKLNPGVTTMAQAFRAKGYKTIMAVDKLELFNPTGLDRGFDHIFARNDLALFNFLDRNRDGKFFLFAHFFDVHAPYLYSPVPPEKDGNEDYQRELEFLYKRFGRKRTEEDDVRAWANLFKVEGSKFDILFPVYVRGVTKFDHGRFRTFMEKLNGISPLESNMLVIFADHGEGTTGRDSDHFGHAGDLFDSVIRVPLIIRHPDLRPGMAGHITSLVDIFPTVLGMNGIEAGRALDGVFMGEGRESIYAETWRSSKETDFIRGLAGEPEGKFRHIEWLLRQRCVRTPSMKFVITGRSEPWLEELLKNSGAGARGVSKLFRVLSWIFKKSDLPGNLPEGAEATFNLSNAEFIKNLYRTVLSRFEDAQGFNNYLSRLESGAMTKMGLLWKLLESKEYSDNPKHFVCDCEKDPFEERPLDPSADTALKAQAQRHYGFISALEASAVQSEEIWNDKAELSRRPEAAHAKQTKTLGEKEEKSIEVIRRAAALYGPDKIGVAWTGGKDSTTVLSLIRQAFGGRVPFKVVNLDTSVKFQEIYEFREKLREEWALDLRIFKNEEALKTIEIAGDHKECCYRLKTVPLNRAIESLGLDALITGVRWDEQEARSEEEYFSVRDEPPHVRVQPILHFTEKDIWHYIRVHGVPYCGLYERGYRSLGCAPCTAPSDGTGPERQGRAMDKEQVMQALRDLGYF